MCNQKPAEPSPPVLCYNSCMLYKPVLFGYVASVILVVASLVLILIMHRQDKQYERNKLTAIVGLLAASLFMNTLYFLSFFDSLTSLKTDYAAIERGLDIACSYGINAFLLLFLHNTACDSSRTSWLKKMFWPAFALLTAASLFAAIVYITVVTDEYRVAETNIYLAEAAQFILTFVICGLTTVYSLSAAKNVLRSKADGARSRNLCLLILFAGFVNIVTAVYNGVQSINLFNHNFDYLNWSGINDYNTWLFIISNLVFLMIVIWFYRTQLAQLASQSAAQDAAAAPEIPEELGLTHRETEIVMLILDRCTYEEIAEELSISKYTVKRHVHNIYEKAGVSRRDELIRMLKQQ